MTSPAQSAAPSSDTGRRRLFAGCFTLHALHDGYTDLIYLLLPFWQAEFGLDYAMIGFYRAVYSGAMAALQVPASLLAGRIGTLVVLIGGTALSALAFLLMGAGAGAAALLIALLIGGIGAAVQHPLASELVTQASAGEKQREALALYNLSGDIGKVVVPLLVAGLTALVSWRFAAGSVGLVGLVVALACLALLRRPKGAQAAAPAKTASGPARSDRTGFALLMVMGVIDTGTRMGYLTFLPFLLAQKGAGPSVLGVALALIFAGGAFGKGACGFLAARLGLTATVALTQIITAGGIALTLVAPLTACLIAMPLIGLALNGTSSVFYGTVPELTAAPERTKAFGLFYTAVIGSGALCPVLYGWIGDLAGLTPTLYGVGAAVLLTIPLSLLLERRLAAG